MERKFLASIISFLSLFLAIYAQSDIITPNYDIPELEIKAYEIKSPLVLSCNVATQDAKLEWFKDSVPVAKVEQLANRFRILDAENKFVIDRTDIHDDGTYTCKSGPHQKDIKVISHVIVRTPSNSGVVEGEKLSIVCTVVGTNPQLSWVVGNTTYYNSTDRYILRPDDNGIVNAIFSIENVSLEDRGEYKCVGENEANKLIDKYPINSDVSYVRVKGKLAALWPFLGICAEVLVLCLIILIYEKRRNKSELEESDTDPQDQ